MLLIIHVQPKANRNAIEVDGDKIVVRVIAAPENGKANDAVVALLAKKLGVAKRSIAVTRGHKARDKQLDIQGIDYEEILRRLMEPN